MKGADSVIRITGYDRDGHLVDTLGRRQATKLNSIWAVRAVPGLLKQFKVAVPGEFWSQDADEDGNPVAIISCPCGQQPELLPSKMIACECDRCYLSLGDEIRVANSPRSDPPTEVRDS